jgi:Protein of unknown function (DUF4058)
MPMNLANLAEAAMPLHDWKDERGWDGVHTIWLTQLLDWVQPRLPEGYRAYVGSVPALTVDAGNGKPDVTVRQWASKPERVAAGSAILAEPDQEGVATFTLDPQKAVHVDWKGQLIAAIELVSPRNKDRPSSRERYLGRYVGYIRQGVHLLLVDVMVRPEGFSFPDAIASDLGLATDPTPPPCAVSYRVGEGVPEGTLLATWRRPMQVGQALPIIPLALDTNQSISIDLEQTYQQSARRAYLS